MESLKRYVGEDRAEGGPTIHRREFLVLGAAGLATPLLANVAAAQEKIAAASAEPMSIGYLEGSESFSHLAGNSLKMAAATTRGEAATPLSVVPARGLPLGDQNLANRTVRIGIQGLYPRVPQQSALDKVDLDVLFPSPDPASDKPLRFFAWSYRRSPGVDASPPVRFVVPLGLDGRLDLSLKVVSDGGRLAERALRGAAKQTRLYGASFTVDWAQDRPKLQRGVYLLGLSPVWDSERILPKAGEKPDMSLLSIIVSVEPLAEE